MSRRIIAIDDSDIAQEVILTTLAEFGFDDVVGYVDPIQALADISAAGEAADLILLDIMMPGMDGIELCARIRGTDMWTDVPIIMLTSRKDMDSLSQAFIAGANDYVTKPFTHVEMQARINNCLRLKTEMDRRRASDLRSGRNGGAPVAKSSQNQEFGLGLELVAGRSALQATLHACKSDHLKGLGLVSFCIDDLHGSHDIKDGDKSRIIRSIGSVFGKLSTPACDLLAHWEDDIFCFVSVTSDKNELMQIAKRFIDAVADSSIQLPLLWGRETATVSAGISSPGTMVTAAAGLADAIIASRQASGATLGSINIAPPSISLGGSS